jgi:DNA-binding transcriptional regulator of glucitol operon
MQLQHFSRAVTEFFNQGYERRWMGRGGLVPWSAQSSDLNQLDFCGVE